MLRYFSCQKSAPLEVRSYDGYYNHEYVYGHAECECSVYINHAAARLTE